jgi:hypothetical protein
MAAPEEMEVEEILERIRAARAEDRPRTLARPPEAD